ncbi:hypothetical protein [Nocardia sp. alder85J]|uniref:hypothetical protein n=1 Tax=Nocardia sp. alder85J TaxID=2862949 RepID=UPI001CD4B1DF|nr:hypothetical protein [Nocardia sp. alder85J]MCX4098065.1 hypothetical protein [Nocardia sp. alder85J]
MNRHALTAALAGALLLTGTGAAAAAVPLEPAPVPGNAETTATTSAPPAARQVVGTGSASAQSWCVVTGSAISLSGSTHLSCIA